MRRRASISFCLVLSATSLLASSASAGFALVGKGFGTGRQSFIAPIDTSKAPLYSANIDPADFVHETTPDGPPLNLTALAELGVSPAAGTLYATGGAPGAPTLQLYTITKGTNAAGATVSVATAKQTIDLQDPNAFVEGAAFDHLGRLLLLVNTLSSRAVQIFEAQGTGWGEKAAKTVPLPTAVVGKGGDLTALRDGRIFIAVSEDVAQPRARYFTMCRDETPIPVARALPTPPTAYCVDGVVAEQQVLAVDGGLEQHGVAPFDAPSEPMLSPFWPHGTTSEPFDEADLAGVVPFFDTDGDGLSDADENACANIRSVAGAGPADYQDADIDDDCLNDKDDIVVGATDLRESRRKRELPNENVDRNCRAEGSTDGADDGAICVLAAGATNPACVPGCRVGIAGSGCAGGLVCVAATGATTGECRPPMPVPVGGSGGMGGTGGSAGRGNVDIDGPGAGAGGAPTTSGAGTAKKDDSGGCAFVTGPGAWDRAGPSGLLLLGVAALGVAGRRRYRKES